MPAEQPERRPLETSIDFTIRPYDIDFGEIVSNIVYVRWLEDLRYQLLNEFLPVDVMLDMGIGPMLTSTHIDYREPLRLLDQVRGTVWVSELTEVRWTVRCQFVVIEAVVAEAVQTGVFVDLRRFSPVRMPQAIKDRFQREIAPADFTSKG